MRKALLALLGAMVGYAIGFLGSQAVFAVIGLKIGAADAVMAVSICFGIPAGGAVFSLLGFWLGCKLDARSRHTASPRKWTAMFASLGAAAGPLIGFGAFHYAALHGERDDHWHELDALAAGLFCGVPVGGILFCLLGFCFGCVLDGRLRHDGSQTGGSIST